MITARATARFLPCRVFGMRILFHRDRTVPPRFLCEARRTRDVGNGYAVAIGYSSRVRVGMTCTFSDSSLGLR